MDQPIDTKEAIPLVFVFLKYRSRALESSYQAQNDFHRKGKIGRLDRISPKYKTIMWL